jgi:DEP domain-containing protein 5
MGDEEAFTYEWMEVKIPEKYIVPPSPAITPLQLDNGLNESTVPSFLKEDFEKRNNDGKLYKQSHLEVDLTSKSDRIEWGHCRYHDHFIPGNPFEIVVQWVTASGPIVYDLVS